MTKIEENQFTFKIKDNRLNYFLFQVKNLAKDLLLHTIKSLIACFIFFTMLSIFIWNIQLQTYHFDKNNKQIVTRYIDLVQCLDLNKLIKEYYIYK